MSQPTTWGSPVAADAPVTPTVVASRIDASFDALLSAHSGALRPAYAVAGTIWHDTDDGLLYHFDGTGDVKLLLEGEIFANVNIDGGAIDGTNIGANVPATGAFTTVATTGDLTVVGSIAVSGTVDGRDVAADGTKADLITVTQAINLDALQAVVVLKGGWDASGGSFPGAAAGFAGWSYQVTVAGVVGGISFSVNDRLIALVDNASTSVYSPNWLKADYTDVVSSVAGQTGIVTIQQLISAMMVEKLDYIPLDLTASHSVGVGEMAWNAEDLCMDIGQPDGVIMQVGQEMQVPVKATETIVDGEVIYVSGAVGASGRMEVTKFIGDGSIGEVYVLGVATQDIALGGVGKVTVFGSVRGIPTNGVAESETWIDGTVLYTSSTVAGRLTSVKPVAPNQAIHVAIVVVAHVTNGTIFVRPVHGANLGELHDVHAPTPADEDALRWETNRWVNRPAGVLASLAVDTDTLFVDPVTGRVGIGTLVPDASRVQINKSLSNVAGVGHLAFGEAGLPLWNWRMDTSSADLILDRSFGGFKTTPVVVFDRSTGATLFGTTVAGSAGAGDIVVNGGIFLGGSAAANKLDDYEEGTWTPTLSDGTNSDATYTIQVGHYIKVGNKVHIQGRVAISSLGTISGGLSLAGLPFTTHNIANAMASAFVSYGVGLSITAGHSVSFFIGTNGTQMVFQIWDAISGTTDLQSSEFSATGQVAFSAEYIAS